MLFKSNAPQYSTRFGLSLTFGVADLLADVAAEMAYYMANREKARISEEEDRARCMQDRFMAMRGTVRWDTGRLSCSVV